MGVSICIASGKDGTGKSLITANLGAALSNMGVNTLVVDGDIKGASIGLIFGVMDPKTVSIHDCLSGKIPPENAITKAFGTKIVVGGLKIQQLMGVTLDNFPMIIESYSSKFEIVLVDSPGGLGSDALMVISSCQSLILIVTPDLNSVIHAIKTLVLAKKVGSRVIGAIINRRGSPYDIPTDEVSDFLRIEVLTEVEEDGKVKKSVHEAVPIVMGYPKSNFAVKIKEIATLLMESILKKE
jgi:septum site-determining protein MinD